MGPTIAATVYGAVAIVAAYFFRPRFADNPAILRAAIFWLAAVPTMFLITQTFAILVALGFMLAVAAPRSLEDRAAFYLMTLVAIPGRISGEIPFPGINYLTTIDFAKISCLVLLAPAIFFGKSPNAKKFAPLPGAFIIAVTILFSLQEFRTANLTSGLRASLDHILLYAIPFMALVRLIADRKHFERLFAAFIFIAVIFFFMAVVSQGTKWNFYSYLETRHGEGVFADFRAGFLRVTVTLNAILVCYMMALGLIAVGYFRSQKQIGFLFAWLYRGMFAVAALFTFARGGWLAIIAGLAVFHLFANIPRGARAPVTVAIAALLAPAAFIYAMTADLNRFDEYGTFAYRQELLRTSIDYIAAHPFFGDPNFRESGAFDHLYQGQGIIDVVNHYVSIGLSNGLIGLGLYLGAFVSLTIGLLRLGKEVRRTDDRKLELQRAALLGAIAAYLVMMATVSAVSLASHIGVFILAISTAFLAAARKAQNLSPAPGQRGSAAPAQGGLYG